MPIQVPETPLLVAGGLGGPAIMWIVTPLRNALTLGANDRRSSMLQLYRQVAANKPYGGGGYMAAAACPGFLVVGPMFHVYNGVVGNSAAACVLTATNEALIFCGSETKNAQVAFNNAQPAGALRITKLHNPLNPFAPGFHIMALRNMVGMSGIRVFGEPCQQLVTKCAPGIPKTARDFLGDLTANIIVNAASAPIHQAYSYCVTQGAILKEQNKPRSIMGFLKKQYLNERGTLSKVAARDIGLRVAYNGTLMTLFSMTERLCVAYWPK